MPQSSDLNTPVLHLDSPSYWCRLRNQEFSPVVPLNNNSSVRTDMATASEVASPTICVPKPRFEQPVNYPVECQNLNTAPSFGSQFFEDIMWPPTLNDLSAEAVSTAESNTGNVYAGRLVKTNTRGT